MHKCILTCMHGWIHACIHVYHPTSYIHCIQGAVSWKSGDINFHLSRVTIPIFLKLLFQLIGSYPWGAPLKILILHDLFRGFRWVYRGLQKPFCFPKFVPRCWKSKKHAKGRSVALFRRVGPASGNHFSGEWEQASALAPASASTHPQLIHPQIMSKHCQNLV